MMQDSRPEIKRFFGKGHSTIFLWIGDKPWDEVLRIPGVRGTLPPGRPPHGEFGNTLESIFPPAGDDPCPKSADDGCPCWCSVLWRLRHTPRRRAKIVWKR